MAAEVLHETTIELEVGPPVHGGHCLARHDGRVVFVRHALPGERVRALLTERRRKGYWRADAVEVLEASPDRVESVWPQAGPGGVGGGELAHVALDAQRTWKRDVVRDALVRIGGLGADDPLLVGLAVEAVPGETDGLGTRTRIELSVDDKGRAGMFGHRSHEVRALSSMPLAVPEIAELDLFARQWPPGARLDVVAPSDGEPVVLVDGVPLRGRRTHVRERVLAGGTEHAFRVAAAGFWQVHRGAPALLVDTVLDAARVEPGQGVLDAYSGAGLLSVPLADATGSEGAVLAVEGDAQGHRDARRNAHGRDWLRLREGDVAPVLEEVLERSARPPDVVVLDPPRAGAGRRVTDALGAARVPRVVYVACDPAALARDVAAAREAGLALRDLRAFDLFPHTHHVECLAVLTPTDTSG